MKELWGEEEASFSGRYAAFDASWAWPKPLQQPHPPIWLGGAGGPKTYAAVVELADGWMPVDFGRGPIVEQAGELRRAAEAAGRDPSTIELGAFGGSADVDYLDRLVDAGFASVALVVDPAGPDVVLPTLDRYQLLVDRYHG